MGGTVCDDNFGDSEADVICQEMGYNRSSGWTNGLFYDVQSSLNISLDNVDCDGESWSTCNYLSTHNCDHSEDVFLTCVTWAGEIFKFVKIRMLNLLSLTGNYMRSPVCDTTGRSGSNVAYHKQYECSQCKYS